MKNIIKTSAFIIAVGSYWSCGPSSLEYDQLKIKTPEQVTELLGISELPKMTYLENTVHREFNWDYWDCVVEFQFEDTLSSTEKSRLVQYAKNGDSFQWVYENLPKEGVVEYYGIKYKETDTIPYNIAITETKVYVAYNDELDDYNSLIEFDAQSYHLIAFKNFLFGIDSSHEYKIHFKRPYSECIKHLKDEKDWEYTETQRGISFIQKLYSQDSILQSETIVNIDKRRNTAIIKYETY